MRSVRLEEELEQRLDQAAEVSGQPVSEIIREGIRKECDAILSETLFDKMKGLIGSMASTPAARRRTDSRKTSEAYGRLLAQEERRKRRR